MSLTVSSFQNQSDGHSSSTPVWAQGVPGAAHILVGPCLRPLHDWTSAELGILREALEKEKEKDVLVNDSK